MTPETSQDFHVTIFHNPACGTSRNTLAMIRAGGREPEVVDYLQTGWTEPQLRELMAASGLSARELMRDKGTPADELGLLRSDATEAAILSAMIAHPILVNRPIVATPKGVKLCRPSEAVFELLDNPPASFTKEDGEVVRP